MKDKQKRTNKIILINQDSGYLVIDIANDFVSRGFDVTLVAGRIVPRGIPLDSSVSVKRIIRYNRSNNLLRILTWFVAFIQILFFITISSRFHYLLIFTNPPLNLFLPIFSRKRYSLLVFDVYPDALIKMNILSENSIFIRLWAWFDKKVYSGADNILTLTGSMASLIKPHCHDKDIMVVPLWGDGSLYTSVPREENPFTIAHKLQGKFIVMYSGNLGTTQNVGLFTEIAQRIDNPNVLLIIIGDGEQRHFLEDGIRKLALNNCLLMPLQPPAGMKYSLAAADVALISLNAKASNLSLPSKTFNYISAGLPLLCIADENSELNRLVSTYKNGKCFSPDRIHEIVDWIDLLSSDREMLNFYSTNSRLASVNFTRSNTKYITDPISKSLTDYQ